MKRVPRSLLIICLFVNLAIGPSESAFSQESRKTPLLQGVVQDFVTRSRVSGASVFIEQTGARLTSDEKGEFKVEGLTPGSYTIHVLHPEHRPLVCKNLELKRGGMYAAFVLKSGKVSDQPYISDGAPRGQFVIDEDAELIERRGPKYPESALKEKAEGTILLWVGVDKKGEVESAMFKEGSKRKDLLEASYEAVQDFKFKPAKVKGKPVEVMVTVPFNFKLADKATRFPLKQEEGPLSNEDITSALSYLGVNIRRFSYELPFKHKMNIYIDQYADGKPIGNTVSNLGEIDPGKYALILYKYEKDGAVDFAFSMTSRDRVRKVHGPKISMKNFPAQGIARVPHVELQSGVKVPFYVQVFSTGGFNFGLDDPVEKIIGRAPRSLVVSVELKLEN